MTDPHAPDPHAPDPHAPDRGPVGALDVGLYVHFPYCERKCPYCDFNVVALRHDDRAYADAILAELAARSAPWPRPLTSLYFGGGTPSAWAPSEVARVIEGARATFGLRPGAEITLEANPDWGRRARPHEVPELARTRAAAAERIAAYAAAGVNRFSLGAQSVLDHELLLLGRTHDAEDVAHAVRTAAALGARVSVDLIYGIPGQTADDVSRSVDRVLELGVAHVSAYTLTVEPRTLFAKRVRQGRLLPMEDDGQAALVEHLTQRLAEAGLRRYEISSYARLGQEAVHNSIYWAGGPYLGLGAGAHSYLPGPGLGSALRRENERGVRAYLSGAREGRFDASFEEHLDRKTAVGDRLLVGLRTAWGLDLEALAREAELEGSLPAQLAPAVDRLVGEGLVERAGATIRPTARGFLFGDHLARTLLGALDATPGP